MAGSIPDDVIWPTSTIEPDEFSTIARVLSSKAFPCWRFVIKRRTIFDPRWILAKGEWVFGNRIGGLVPYQPVPFIPKDAPYVAPDASLIHEVLEAWYAGPRDTGKLCVFFEEGYGVKLRRGDQWQDPFRAQLVYPKDESHRLGETCAAAFAGGWRWDKTTRNTLFRAGTSPGDISRLAALLELTAKRVFNAHQITEVWVAPYGRYRS